MSNEHRIQLIRERLQSEFQPEELDIRDDSHLHVGHAGARDGRGHFHVSIRADAFEGKRPLARHKLIYEALGDLMKSDIHALQISAKSSSEG